MPQFVPPNPLEEIKRQLGLGVRGNVAGSFPQQPQGGILSQLGAGVPATSQAAGAQALSPAGNGGDGGFLQKLLQLLQLPAFQQTAGAIGSAAAGPRELRGFQRQTALSQQGEQLRLDRGLAERRDVREQGEFELKTRIGEEDLLTSQQTRSDKDRTAAIRRATQIASIPDSTYSDLSPEDQPLVSPNVFRALKNKGAIARIEQVDKLGGLLARNPEAPIPKPLQGAFSPSEITIAREIGRELKKDKVLSIREIKSQITARLSQPLGAGQLTETTDPETGEVTRSEQVPFQPRQETAQQAENRFREEIAERFEKGEISKDMLNFLAGGKFGNSTKEELDIISLASVLAEVRGIKSKAGILEDMRTIVASVDPELAKKIPEMFVESESAILGIDKTKLRIPGEGVEQPDVEQPVEQPDVEQPKAARKVGDRVNTPKGPAVITAINEDGTIEVEFE